MYRLSSSNLIRKGLARVHLFVLSLRYRYALLVLRSPARRDVGWMLQAVFSFQFRNLSEPEGSPSGAEAPVGRSLSRRPQSEIRIWMGQLFMDDMSFAIFFQGGGNAHDAVIPPRPQPHLLPRLQRSLQAQWIND